MPVAEQFGEYYRWQSWGSMATSTKHIQKDVRLGLHRQKSQFHQQETLPLPPIQSACHWRWHLSGQCPPSRCYCRLCSIGVGDLERVQIPHVKLVVNFCLCFSRDSSTAVSAAHFLVLGSGGYKEPWDTNLSSIRDIRQMVHNSLPSRVHYIEPDVVSESDLYMRCKVFTKVC